MNENEQEDITRLREEIAKLRDEVRQLKSEKKKLRGQLAEEVIDSRINLATAMVMANEFGCDLEVYKKKPLVRGSPHGDDGTREIHAN